MGNREFKRKCPECDNIEYYRYNNNESSYYYDERISRSCVNCRKKAKEAKNALLPKCGGCKNILIEYDGEHHFHGGTKFMNHTFTQVELENLQYRDKIKTKYAKNEGIKLIRISYKQQKKINNILKKELK